MTNFRPSREKTWEKRLSKDAKQLKGHALKFWPISITGFPDRIVLIPPGKVYFVELKDNRLLPEGLQKVWASWLIQKGFNYRLINSEQSYQNFYNEIYAL